jgi:hypothetical protein
MVKADVRRDYYADLGVGPGADTDEIKKQFRKLGTFPASVLPIFHQRDTNTLLYDCSFEISSRSKSRTRK